MPKIRGVKPEYWTDEDIVELSIAARLLFIGMWNFACDNGHMDDKPRQIKMRIFPADDLDIESLLDELVTLGRITRGGGVITIHRFSEHQKPHKRWFQTCDQPGCTPPDGTDQPLSNGGKGSTSPPDNGGPTVDQPLSNGRPTADGDGDGDGEGDCDRIPSPAAAGDAFGEFWSAYPRKVGKGHARKAYTRALKRGSPEDILAGCRRFAEQSRNVEPRFVAHASTWLNGDRWTDEPDNVRSLPGPDGTSRGKLVEGW